MKNFLQNFFRVLSTDKFWYFFIFCGVFAVFSTALGNSELISDDLVYFLNARSIASSFKNSFLPVLGLCTPLTGLSLYLNYLTGGEENFVLYARLTNILLHCGTAVLFYVLLRQLRWRETVLSAPWAGMTALLFALHPQRVESVVWVAERKDCLAMFLGLAGLVLFFSALRKNRISLFSPVLFILSLAAKPMWIFFPVPAAALIWSYYRTFSLKTHLKFLIPSLVITSGVMFACLVSALNAIENTWGTKNSISLFLKLEIICHNFGNYFLKTLIPGELLPFYPLYAPEGAARLIAFLPLCFVLLCVYLYKKNRSLFVYGVLPVAVCYIFSLLPVVGFIKIGNADFADRYSYMPALFLWAAAAFFLHFLSEKFEFAKKIVPVSLCCYCAALAIHTCLYIPVWTDSGKMDLYALRPLYPNPSVGIAYAVRLYHAGNYDEMFRFMNSRLPERPHYSETQKHIIKLFKISAAGAAFIRHGRAEEGMRYLNIIYSIDGNGVIRQYPLSFLHDIFTLGAAYFLKQKKNPEAAAAICRGAARIIKHHAVQYEHYYNGLAAMLLEKYDEAADLFQKCLVYAPNDPEYRKKYEEAKKAHKVLPHEISK